jgi:hypothetical protein
MVEKLRALKPELFLWEIGQNVIKQAISITPIACFIIKRSILLT